MMLAHARAVLAFKRGGFSGKIGVIQSLEYKYPLDENSAADINAAKNEDVLQNQFLLDATFRGDYAADTLEVASRLAAVSGGSIEIREDDLAVMREAAALNDYLASTTTKAASCAPTKAKTIFTTTARAKRERTASAWRAWASA